ncbi:MAG TPA: HEAT repeat domain-containing protein [Armatimonadota bacterium]|nr:HEAT repeat domain-containing protein [Armatimonadota bacterium]
MEEDAKRALFLDQIKSADADARYRSWRSAGPVGSKAVPALGDLLSSPDKGVAKSAKGALETIALYAGRPHAAAEAHAVSEELLKIAASDSPIPARAEALRMLGFTADRRSVPAIARLLNDPAVRDEARMALERIPGRESLDALRSAVRTAPEEFKPNLEQSVYNRGLRPATIGIVALTTELS